MANSAKKISLAPVNDLHKVEKRWFAVYTKYKAEKHIIKSLQRKGIEAYTPLLKKTKKYTRKIKITEVPLINCYIFVKVSEKEYVKVLETEHVISYLKIRNNFIAIPEREIDLMKRVVGEYEEVSITNEEYNIGDQVEVVSGNLTGLKGSLVNINGKKDFLIKLEKSGFQLLINIDPKLIRPIGLAVV